MNYELLLFFSSSIIIASLLGFFRYRDVTSSFHPFLFLVWSGLVSAAVLIIQHQMELPMYHTYVIFSLVSALLILWQFERWKGLGKTAFQFYMLSLLILAAWVPTLWQQEYRPYFEIMKCLIMINYSIHMINRSLVSPMTEGKKDPVLLICIGFLVYFAYQLFSNIFKIWNPPSMPLFNQNISAILAIINLFVNLAFALAIIWMPRKPKFLLQS